MMQALPLSRRAINALSLLNRPRYYRQNPNKIYLSTSTLLGKEQHILKSPIADIKPLPDQAFLGHHLLEQFRSYGDKTAVVDGLTGKELTYSKLIDRITSVASGLVRLGVKPGDVVTLFAANCAEFIIAYMAIVSVGAVCSAINPYYVADEFEHAATFNECKMIITSADLYGTVAQALSKNVTKIPVIVFNGQVDKCQNMQSLYNDNRQCFPEQLDLNPDVDVCTLPFSSGTTGLPKGVMLTHTNILSNMLQASCPGMLDYNVDDVLLGQLPFYHLYGLTVVMIAGLFNGCKVVTLPKFSPDTFLKTIQNHKITVLHAAPPMMVFLAKSPEVENYDLSSVTVGISGAAPIGQHTLSEAERRMRIRDRSFHQAYGLTETSPVTNCSPRDPSKTRSDSVGPPVSNSFMKVVDISTGETLPADKEGELCFKGPHIMKGYLKNEKSTQDTIKDGWLHSGDIGYYDKDGYTYVTERLKELIKVKGFQVAPAELESLLLNHPCVKDCAVIGVQDERAGELPRAYVVLKEGKQATEHDVKGFLKDKVAAYKQLDGGIEFIDVIPKSPSGKILRRELRADYQDKMS